MHCAQQKKQFPLILVRGSQSYLSWFFYSIFGPDQWSLCHPENSGIVYLLLLIKNTFIIITEPSADCVYANAESFLDSETASPTYNQHTRSPTVKSLPPTAAKPKPPTAIKAKLSSSETSVRKSDSEGIK